MKYLILNLLILFSANSYAESLVLGVGSSNEIKVSSQQTVRVSQSRIVKVYDQIHSIKVVGKKPGTVTIDVGTQSFLVSVIDAALYRLYQKMQAKIDEMKGLQLEVKDKSLIISGKLLRLSDWKELKDLAQAEGQDFVFSAVLAPQLVQQAEDFFKGLLKEHHIDGQAKLEPPARIFVGQLSKARKEQAQRLLKSWGITVEEDPLQLDLLPLVRVRVLVAEVSRRYHQVLGVDWSESVEAKFLPKPFSFGEISAALRAMENKGQGQILASPNLLTRSGSTAEFLAGGEFPIRTKGYRTQNVIWKKHGVLLQIKPRADHQGKMSIEVLTEVSLLEPGVLVDGLPSLKTSRISTHFDLSQSRTIALSGLIQHNSGQATEGLPFLSKIPILGGLFRSEDFQKGHSELVIFVTPEIIQEPGDDLTLPEGWNNEWNHPNR